MKLFFIHLIAVLSAATLAAMENHTEFIKTNNRDPNIRLLVAMTQSNTREIRKAIKEGADTSIQDAGKRTPLIWAINQLPSKRNTKLVNWLILKTTDLEIKDNDGDTALACAVIMGRTKICKHLIEAGAQVNTKNALRLTPLIQAINKGHEAISKLLITHGAYIHATEANESLPLHFAAYHNQTNICETLLAAGAEVNALEEDFMTPLHNAAANNADACCRLLLKHGADPTMLTDCEETPLETAVFAGSNETIEELIIRPLFLRYQTKEQLNSSKNRILYTLWALKQICPLMPRDIKYFILCASEETKIDMYNCAFKFHFNTYAHIPFMPLQVICLLLNAQKLNLNPTIQTMKTHCISSLKPLIESVASKAAQNRCPQDILDMLEVKNLETKYGKAIEENIQMRLIEYIANQASD